MVKVLISYSIVAISTESVKLMKFLSVNPPTTISWLLGRTAAIHVDRGVAMWLMTAQESVVRLYM